jgi:hypothetical protein
MPSASSASTRMVVTQPKLRWSWTKLAVALCPKDTLAGVLLSHLPRVLSAGRCLIIEGGATLDGAPILFRSALLPLSDDGMAIDHVLGAANHRTLRAGDASRTQLISTLFP